MARVPVHEILVIVFRAIEAAILDARRDRAREAAGLVELRDIAPRHFALAGILREDRRAVVAPDIGALAIHLCRIVRDGEKDA